MGPKKYGHIRYIAFLMFCLMYLLLIPWAAAQGNGYRDNQIIVRLKDSYRVIDTDRLASLGLKVTSKEVTRSGLQLWHLAPGQDVQEAVYKVAKDPAVLYAEPNYLYHSLDTTVDESVYVGVYGDPYRSEQWYLDAMNLPGAWQKMQQPAINQVTVAVVDSGIDGSHPDLPPLLEGFDFVKGSSTSPTYDRKPEQNLPEDPLGHGTAIAGLIAAVADNNEGIMGVANEVYAPHVQILPVRVLDSEGWGDAYTIAMGIRWAVGEEINGHHNDHPAVIINLSLGGEVYSSTLAEAIRYAQQKGALVVAAAGNEGVDAASIFPASLPGVLTVGAAVYGSLVNGPGAEDWRQASGWYLPYFTNYGREVEVLAPGVNILSTYPLSLAGNGPSPGYKWVNGTSFAAGLVTGLAAFIEAKGDSWRGGLLADLLANSGPELTSPPYTYRIADANLTAAGEHSPPAVAILDPKPGEVLNGITDIAVVLGEETERVELTLVELDDKELIPIGQARGMPASVQLFTWNLPSSVTPGNYRLVVTAYKDDQILGRAGIDVTVAGNITLMVKPPTELASSSTEIALVAGDNPQQVIWHGQTDYLGKVVIPTEVAARTAGTTILAYGLREMETRTPGGERLSTRAPYFFYWRQLDAPLKTSLILDGHDAVPLHINGNLTNWQWVEDRAWATLLDENGRPIFGFLAAFASSQDGQEPDQGIIYVTPGKYAFRIKGVYLDLPREKMVLALQDDTVNVDKEEITLAIDPNKLAGLQWNWHHFSGARLFDLDIDLTLESNKIPYNDQYFGFKKEDFSFGYSPGGEGYSSLQELLVTPGNYKATLLMGKKEITTGNFLWSYTFAVPELNVPPEGVTLGLSPELQGSFILNGGRFKAGEVIPFSLKVDDGWGQQLVRGWDGLLGEIKPTISLQAADGTMVPLTSYEVDYRGGWLLLPPGLSPGLYTLEVGSFTLHSPWAGRETPATAPLEVYADENTPPIPGPEPGSNPGSSNDGGTGNINNGGGGQAANSGKGEETKPYYAIITSSDQDITLVTPGEELTVLIRRGSLPAHTTVSLAPAGNDQVRILQDKSSPFSGKLLAAFELTAIGENGQPITAVSSPLTLNFKLRAIKESQTSLNGAANEINNPGCYIFDPVYAAMIPLNRSYRQADGQIMVTSGLIGLYALMEEEPAAINGLSKDEWYAPAVSKLACRNLLPQSLKASFNPDAVLTRAQAARLVALAGQIPGRKGGAGFPDLQDERLAVFIDSLAAEGLVSGYPDGSFQPQRSVTRAEMTSLICRVLDRLLGESGGLNTSASGKVFYDVNNDYWAYGVIQKGAAIGFVGGYPDGNFKPEAPVSWAEAASMVIRAFPGLF